MADCGLRSLELKFNIPQSEIRNPQFEMRWMEKAVGSREASEEVRNASGYRPSAIDSRLDWAGLAVVAVAFVIAAAFSWRKWPDVLIDFGLQLYLPWRICHGAVLYRDLHYLAGGPFSQYFNALLFEIFGVSFRTLIFANLVITGAMLVLVYRSFLAAADRWTATTICLGIVFVFAFNEYLVVGNYNYIAPYSHELFHGLVLSIVAVMLLSSWINKQRLGSALAAGFCFGLVFLTKPELFLALAAAVIAAFILFQARHRQPGALARSAAGFLAVAVIPVLGFFFYFLSAENWRASLYSTAFAWAPLWLTPVARNPFYQWCMGLDAPLFHLRQMAIQFFCVVLLVGLYARLFQRKTGFGSKRITWLVLVIPLLAAAGWFNWLNCGASLPLLAMAACILLATRDKWQVTANGSTASNPSPVTFPLLWSVFSLVLLAKLGLFPRIWHYGFALAMPAAVTAIYLLLWLVPRFLEKRFDVDARPFRLAVWLVLMIGFGVLFHDSETWYSSKTLAVGTGGDRIYGFSPALDPEGEEIRRALALIEKSEPGDATLAVLPEGTMINYLSRRINPTPCLDWMPTVLAAFGQADMTAAFEKNPPDYICLVSRDTSEFGVGPFGKSPGYGLELMQWIDQHYGRIYLTGSEPGNRGFGLEMLQRLTGLPKTSGTNWNAASDRAPVRKSAVPSGRN